MEMFFVLGVLVLLAALALRFGHDSRERLPSEEERLAQRGFAWGSSEFGQSRATRVRLSLRVCCVHIARRVAAWGNDLAARTDPADSTWPALRDYPYRSSSSR